MNGKKIIGVFLILTSFVFMGCDVKINVNDKHKDRDRGELKDIDKDFNIDNVKNLKTSISAANVNVNLGDNDNLKINGKLYGGEEDLVVRENGSDLSIEDKDFSYLSNDHINIDMSIFKDNDDFENNKVNITIPKKYKENLNLTFGFGDIKIKDIDVKNLELQTGAGNIGINNIVFSSLDYKAGAGNLDMQLDKKCGSMDIKGGVGNIKIKLAEVGGNLDFQGGVGNTNISIPKNSPVRINASNGLGQVNINAETSGEGKYVFDLKSGVGNISVK